MRWQVDATVRRVCPSHGKSFALLHRDAVRRIWLRTAGWRSGRSPSQTVHRASGGGGAGARLLPHAESGECLFSGTPVSDPDRKFQTAFWDIMTDVRAPAIGSSAPEGATVEEARVAVVIEDEADIRSLLSADAGAGLLHGLRRRQRRRTAWTLCAGYQSARHDARRQHARHGWIRDRQAHPFGREHDRHRHAQRAHSRRSTRCRASSPAPTTTSRSPSGPASCARASRRCCAGRVPSLPRRPLPQAPAAAPEPAPVSDGWLEHRGLRLNPDMRIVAVDGREPGSDPQRVRHHGGAAAVERARRQQGRARPHAARERSPGSDVR